jgi:transketolase
MTMRGRFYRLLADALAEDERVWAVLADIGASELPTRHPRVVNVGIREQLLLGVAAGLALEGRRPVVHSYAPFLVERPWEQLKLDLGHQDVGAVLVSNGASYDSARSGRTHQAPEDVALVATLPGWRIEVPGHPDELERAFRAVLPGDGRAYIRTSIEENDAPVHGDGLVTVRAGSTGAALVVAVGPSLAPTLAAVGDLDVSLAYLTTVRPFPRAQLRAALGAGTDVVLVEPYLAGTSAADTVAALVDRPHRLLALGIENPELRRYGTPEEHRAAHGLDAAGIRRSLDLFLEGRSRRRREASATPRARAAS